MADNGWQLLYVRVFLFILFRCFFTLFIYFDARIWPAGSLGRWLGLSTLLKHLNENKIFILCSQYVVNLVVAADETKRN